jgi:ABC-type hemin transport system substrate-binding protein
VSLSAARFRWSPIWAVLIVLLCFACERPEPSTPPDGDAQRAARIVSLSPGVTATLVELGIEKLVVGRTPWCSGVSNAPAVGTLLDIDAEAIVRANPTLIFVQPPAQGIPAALIDLAQKKGWSVVPIQLASLADCKRAVRDIAAACAPLLDEAARAQMQDRVGQLSTAFDAATAPITEAANKRILSVLCGEEDADLLAFGIDTYLMDALQSMGFAAALDRAGYQSLGQEDLLRLKPDIVILLGRGRSTARFDTLVAGGTRVVRVQESALLQPGGGITASLDRLRARLVFEVQSP